MRSLSVYKGGLGVQKHAKGSNDQGGAVADPVMRHGFYTITFVIERGDAGNFVCWCWIVPHRSQQTTLMTQIKATMHGRTTQNPAK